MTSQLDATAEAYNWARSWIPFESLAQGEPSAHSTLVEPSQNAVALRDLTDTPCLVLLGEAGMGKTHEVEGLAALLRRQNQQVDLLQGSDPALKESLEALLQSEHQRRWSEDDCPWHILIDGIDEIGRAPVVPEQLLGNFLDRLFASNRKITFLRIVMTCRTAAWTEALDQLIEERWPAGSFMKLVLEPLSELDIRNAIELAGPQGTEREHLSAQLLDQRLRPMAARPLLLTQMLRIFRADHSLPTGQADLLQRVVEAALSGPDEPDVDRRLAVVGRLAAASTLANLARLTTAPGAADPRLLSVPRIAGGVEPSGDGRVIATPALLSRCLHSALFVEVEPKIFEWSHRSFSDYLTARYLAEHRLSADQILSLLNVQEVGGPGGIAPHLLEVAGWTAAMVQPFFTALLERQPDVLLQSQAAVLDPYDRARLAAALLTRFASGDLIDQYQQISPLLGRLDHPGLADQLQPVMADRGRTPLERIAAIDIATATGTDELNPILVDVAADPRSDGHIRALAARAALKLGGEQSAATMAPILAGDLSSDTEDRLRGVLLAACWPDHLTFRTMLGALTVPKQSDFIGSYQLFLYRFAPPEMTVEHAIEGLSWLQRRLDLDHGNHGRLLPVMAKLFWASISKVEDPAVRKAVAGFIVAADHEVTEIVSADRAMPAPWPDDSQARCDLVAEVLAQASDPVRASILIHNISDLVQSSDIQIFRARLAATQDQRVRAGLAQIVAGLESAAADRMSRSIERENKAQRIIAQQEASASAWLQVVTKLLDRIDAGAPELWWQLNLQLFHEPNGYYDAQFEFDMDLTRTPGWRALNDELRMRILRSAPSYLVDAPLTDLSWLGSNTSHRPATAGLRALYLLRGQAPGCLNELPPKTWAVWAPAILGFFGNDFHDNGGTQRELLREAYRVAPEAVLSAIKQIATGKKSEGLTSRVLELLDNMLDQALADLLHSLRDAKDLKGENAGSQILSFLVRNGDAHAIALIRARLAASAADEKRSATEESGLARGAVELLLQDTDETWLALLELRERDETFARNIWRKLAKEVAFNRAFELETLTEYALAQGYLDLAALLPDRPPDVTGARVLGVPDYVEQLRSHLLSRLIEIGTNAALTQLYRIQDELPGSTESLRWSIEEARRNVRRKSLPREDPADILARIEGMRPPLTDSNTTLMVEGADVADDTDAVPFETDIPAPRPAPTGPLVVGEQRTILAIATEWASHHGGISTVNRELCAALAALGHKVTCLVPDTSDIDKNAAKGVGVKLIECPNSMGICDQNRFLLCLPEHLDAKPDLVIGHDHITGTYARALAERFGAKYVHFLHTIPQENEGLKSPRGDRQRDVLDGEAKLESQLKLAGIADLVVAVGPRIQKRFLSEAIDPPPVTMLLPGLDPELMKLMPKPENLQINSCSMSGRMEDAGVKGGLLACEMIKMVNRGRKWPTGMAPVMVMRGFSRELANAEFANIGNFRDYSQFVQLRTFSTDAAKIRQGYLSSALIIMPSVAEGFGLTGLEAIAAGVPVIISEASGLAEYLLDGSLNQGLDITLVEPCIAPVTLDDAANWKDWAEKADAALSDHATAFARAAALREMLKQRLTWESAARKLSEKFLTLYDNRDDQL